MKKILLKSMLLIAGLFGSITANAYDFEVDGIYYNKTSETTVEVSKNGDNSYSGSVVIPASVSNGVTSYSVTKIGYGAFLLCKGLTSVTIPNSVTEIGQIVFSYCTSLKEIIVDSENPSYSDLDGVLFNKDKTTLIAYPNAKSSTAYTIPNSVTSIGTSAFETCTGLTNVTIPNSVTEIGYGAFAGCTGLTNVTIPNSVTSIGEWAFASCTSLISVEIPNSVASIGNDAFHYCSSLTSIEIPNSVTELGRYAFMLCTSLTSATIGNSVTSIREWAFRECTNLTSVTIGNSVTSIGQLAFSDCKNLTSVTIGNSVMKIGEEAFRFCTSLTSVEIPNSVTSIDYDAFFVCTSLKEFIVDPENPNYSDLDGVLYNKDKSTLVAYPNAKSPTFTIPYSVTKIGELAFADCKGLTNVEIPNSVKEIGYGAFSDCIGLTSVGIPNSVMEIGGRAFSGCSGLTSIAIPNSVDSIGELAFRRCTGLKAIYNYSERPQEITEYVFKYVDETCTLYVPAGCADAYRAADVWKEFNIEELEFNFEVAGIYYKITSETDKTAEVVNAPVPYSGNVVIPASVTHEGITYSVTSIGKCAFSGCAGLAGVTIPNSVTTIGEEAFWKCTGLTCITFPNSIKEIGQCAFSDCTGLTSITIPNSLTSIGYCAFTDCSGLKEFIVASDNPNYSVSDGVLFNKDKTTLVAYPIAKSSTTYTIPNTVTYIGGWAFTSCTGLTNVEIPNSVTEIGMCAFRRCTGLTSVTIPNSVTRIVNYVFHGCSSLKSVEIPNSVTSISESAFSSCTDLTGIYNYSEEPQEIRADVFNNVNKSPCTLYVPAGCADAYRAADVWKEFNIEEMESNIEIAGIYYNITSKADKTVEVTYRDNNYNSYSGDVVIPASVTIGGETYSVTEIGKDAFSYCDDLASVTIPNSITKIGEQTFSGCTSLACVIIPKSVKEISPTAFSGCTGLEEIYNYSEEPQQVANVFANVNIPNCKLYVPTGYAQTYRTAEIWKDFDIQEFTPTGVEAVTGNEVNIAVVGNTITINGAAETAKVAVYGINGELVYSGVAKSITVPAHGVYIVRVAGVTKKVTF